MKKRYGFALVLALVEVFVRAHLTPAGGMDARLIPFSPAVLLAAWLGGMGPGLLATFVCALGAARWLPPADPLGVAHPLDPVALMLFVAGGVVLSAVIGKLHRTRRRAEKESVQARAAADAANRAKDESLALLGHEIGNPLAAITMAVHALDHSGTPAQHPAHLVIIRAAEQLARIGDDILDFGRITAGKIVLERRPIDLADAIRRCLDALGVAGRTADHIIDVETEPVWVAADPVRLEQVAADDYLTKPFDMMELLARAESLLRRARTPIASSVGSYAFEDVHVDFYRGEVVRGGRPVGLSALEFKLLQYLVEHRGQVVTRDRLLQEVWGYDVVPYSRTPDVHVASLRQQLEPDPSRARFILTLHGHGYKFVG